MDSTTRKEISDMLWQIARIENCNVSDEAKGSARMAAHIAKLLDARKGTSAHRSLMSSLRDKARSADLIYENHLNRFHS